MLNTKERIIISTKKYDFFWVLFLGILPFDKAALSFFLNERLGNYISLGLNILVVILALFFLLKNLYLPSKRSKIAIKYALYFLSLFILYLLGTSLEEEFSISRLFSLFCVFAYYIVCVYKYEKIIDLLKDINTACFFIILLSVFFYITNNPNVFYTENAFSIVFKGIAANRNSYADITLFYIATSFCLYIKTKRSLLFFLVSILIAFYTTLLTESATASICMVLLIILLCFLFVKRIPKFVSFNAFFIGYAILFSVLVLFQYVQGFHLDWLFNLFGKNSTLTGRTELWKSALEAFEQKPLTGWGYDTQILKKLGMNFNDPHNSFLYIMVTQGVLGVIAFLVILLPIFRRNNCNEIKSDAIYWTMQSFIIIWMIRGLVESIFSYPHFVFWISVIILDIMVNKEKDEEVL